MQRLRRLAVQIDNLSAGYSAPKHAQIDFVEVVGTVGIGQDVTTLNVQTRHLRAICEHSSDGNFIVRRNRTSSFDVYVAWDFEYANFSSAGEVSIVLRGRQGPLAEEIFEKLMLIFLIMCGASAGASALASTES